MRIRILLTLANLSLIRLRSISMFGTNKNSLGNIFLGVSEVSITKAVSRVKNKDMK